MNNLLTRCVVLPSLIALQLAAVGCGGPEARKEKALTAGRQFLAEENYDKARVELRNVLQIDPNDVEARYLSGVISERLDNVRQAAAHYSAAVDIDAEHVAARAGLAKIHVMAGLPDEAINIVEEGLSEATPPQRAELFAVRGAAFAQKGLIEDAHTDALSAVADDPENEQAIALLGGVLARLEDRTGAEQVLNEGISKLGDTIDLRIARALLAEQAGDIELAEGLYQDVVTLEPDILQHRNRLAAFFQRQDQSSKAEKVLRDALDVAEDRNSATDELIGFIESVYGPDAAETELLRIADEPQQAIQAGLKLGEFYERNGRSADAIEAYRKVADRAKGQPEALSAKARIAARLINDGQRNEGVELLESVLEGNPRDTYALRARAALSLQEGRPDDAIVDFRTLVRDNPESIANHLGLARAHLMKGENGLGEEALRNAVRAEPGNLDTRVQLAQFMAKSGRTDAADDLIRSVLVSNPSHMAARETSFRIAASTGAWEKAEQRAADIIDIDPQNALGHYFIGMAYEGQGDEESALAAYSNALQKTPDAAEPLTAWSRIMVRRGEFEDALEMLAELSSALPEDLLILNLRGEVFTAAGRQTEARAIFNDLIERQPTWWIPYRSLSRTFSDPEQAIAALKGAIDTGQAPVALAIDLASRYEQVGNSDAAIALYEKLLANGQASDLLANNLAMLLVNHRDDPASLSRAAELTANFSTSSNPSLLNTFGWVQLKNGQVDKALPVLQQAVALQPKSPIMRYHLGMAWLEKGNGESAATELNLALQEGDAFPGVETARAALDQLKTAGANSHDAR